MRVMERRDPQGPRCKYWMFTINNPTNIGIPRTWQGTDYCCWQLEKGEQGTPHLQGYVAWPKPRRLSELKKVHSTAHWEPRLGDHQQAKVGVAHRDPVTGDAGVLHEG